MLKYVDPINGKEIPVRSVYYPSKTLLQGKEYRRSNDYLNAQKEIKETK